MITMFTLKPEWFVKNKRLRLFSVDWKEVGGVIFGIFMFVLCYGSFIGLVIALNHAMHY